MILNNLIPIKLGSLNIKHYRELGYNGKYGEEILVAPIHLQDGSIVKEERICDCCGEKYSRKHSQHIKSFLLWGEDVCNKCSKDEQHNKIIIEKRKQVLLQKYGEDNPSKIIQFQEKREQTILKRYGVKNYFQAEDFDGKRKETNLYKYGTEFASQNKQIQEQIKKTCLERYGVDNPTLNKEIRKKQIETCLEKYGSVSSLGSQEIREKGRRTLEEKYGYDNPRKIPELQEKAMKTKISRGRVPTSQQQIQVNGLLKEMFPFNNVELNYVVSSLSLDTVLFLNNTIKIDVEYDGNYWHQDSKKDRRRDEFLKSRGFKILRIRSGRMLPTKEQLGEAIDKLKDRNFIEIVLPDWFN